MMARPPFLLAVGQRKRVQERGGMRPRQHGERAQPFGMLRRDDPGQAAAPVMANQMKAACAMADGGRDVERIAHQPVDAVGIEILRIGSRPG